MNDLDAVLSAMLLGLEVPLPPGTVVEMDNGWNGTVRVPTIGRRTVERWAFDQGVMVFLYLDGAGSYSHSSWKSVSEIARIVSLPRDPDELLQEAGAR
jgi:hypothetical protein